MFITNYFPGFQVFLHVAQSFFLETSGKSIRRCSVNTALHGSR